MKFNATKREVGDVTIIDVNEAIDLYNANFFKQYVYSIFKDGALKVILNLEKVNYLDSTGLGALIAISMGDEKGKGSVGYYNLSGFVKDLFFSNHLTNFLDVFGDEKDALEKII
jgi:anti-sigma B factor antagonist